MIFFNPLNIDFVFFNLIILFVVNWGHNHAFCSWKTLNQFLAAGLTGKDYNHLTVQPLLWRLHIFLECQKETSKQAKCTCLPILQVFLVQFLPLYRRLGQHHRAWESTRSGLDSPNARSASPVQPILPSWCSAHCENSGRMLERNLSTRPMVNMSNIWIQPFFQAVRRSQFSCLGAAIHGDHVESNSGINLSHLDGSSGDMQI